MSVVSARAFVILGLLALPIISISAIIIVSIIVTMKNSNRNKSVYIPPQEKITPRQEEIRKTLGEMLKELRTERNMTQEFVAESVGVTRQAVSKWENGTSEPSTTNLIAIAKLYEIPPEELLKKLL